ncbi:hypothetical protein GCM10009687_06090 [Asanoa iriomotensis]|uniref:Uncharacterized protein n=1 Tax=Asanoa iriomotensis TaxID=234613 RepID=A0ABQ4C1K0_9ACTN|nr:hypothetical protein Air01nite_27550 [Asanoa iriomotensis]
MEGTISQSGVAAVHNDHVARLERKDLRSAATSERDGDPPPCRTGDQLLQIIPNLSAKKLHRGIIATSPSFCRP